MVRTQKKLLPILLLCVLALTAARCSDSQATSLEKADDACGAMAASISAAITLSDKLAEDKHITPAQEKLLNQLLLGVNSSTKIFYSEVAKAKAAGKWNADVKATLANSFVAVNAELSKLNSAGVFDLSDPESKAKLDVVLKSIHAAAAVISATLAN